MKYTKSSRTAPVLIVLLCLAGASNAEKSELWPDRWLKAESDFGSLVIEYRLTDDCEIDREFEIVVHPQIEVTRDEIYGSMEAFLRQGTQENIPDEAVSGASLEVFGQETLPDRVIEKPEYEALVTMLETLGPWPMVRTLPVGGKTFRCTYDSSGALIKTEQSEDKGESFRDVLGSLNEEGPFRFRWEIEE